MLPVTGLVTVAATVLLLAACGGGGGERSSPSTDSSSPVDTQPDDQTPAQASDNPAYHLGTTRFTTHQPRVLEQVGAHHAYARGLTGRGVRIGIEDTIVDFTQTVEFGNRVKLSDADGAELLYWHPLGDLPSSEVALCRRNATCRVWRGESGEDDESYNLWAQQIVKQAGWPTTDDSIFILDMLYSANGSIEQLYRWWEVPTPYGVHGRHGTAVASVASGTNLGIAPEATIIPIAKNLSDDQSEENIAERALQLWIATLADVDRLQLDQELARLVREDYSKFDIINRSYGSRLSDIAVIDSIETASWFNSYLPNTLDAIWQSNRLDAEKTIIVYAAGNDGDSAPGLGALLPYGFPELRGHSLAVAATDPITGSIADYSNRCGPLPSNWNAARHGRHYCLVAPGTVRGLVPDPAAPGNGDTISGLHGTSFAAPIVSGALALMMEHFRGTRGNTEIVRRVIDTTNRAGRYADLETYGAGHLDIAAALSPVGSLSAGSSAQPLSQTTLQTPTAFGSVSRRVAGIELAAFDAQEFPFWVSLSGLISAPAESRSPIPEPAGAARTDTPATGLSPLGLRWTSLDEAGGMPFLDNRKWAMGFGPSSASLARLPHAGEWGYGFSFDNKGHLGSRTSGAFGSEPRSGLIWASRAFRHRLGMGWTLDTEGTLAYSVPRYQDDAIFSASPSVMSAMSMRIGTEDTGLIMEQPLRAETGTGAFRVENGRIRNGRRLYDEYRIPLRPGARELRMAVRHQREAFGGDIAVEIGHSLNHGHVAGEFETGIGVAYRTAW